MDDIFTCLELSCHSTHCLVFLIPFQPCKQNMILLKKSLKVFTLLLSVALGPAKCISIRTENPLEFTQMALESCVKTDWALKSSGATIDTQRTSQTYDCKDSCLCRILRFFWTASPPDTILQPNVFPGNCWAFKGHQGQVVIRLPARVYLTAITVQHITKEASPSGTVISAPKDIAVFGVDADREEETLLGMFTYNVEKDPMQTFPLKNMLLPRAFSHVKLLVKSNWGNPWYTCIYRVKVHGKRKPERLNQGPR
ncbi:LOW QUALITY PROTEIN: SUN domain-containing protein 5-like [Acridotheres tristis]